MSIHDGHRLRLKSLYRKEGLDSFEQVNVLELLLFYCVQRKDTNALAHRLLDHFGSLSEVLDASPQELEKIEGVGEHVATFLSMIPDVSRYYLVNRAGKGTVAKTPDSCGALLSDYFVGQNHEVVYMLCLDAKCKVLCCRLVGKGSVNSASISVRTVVEIALGANATSVVLAHNHPSGLAIPSADDIQTTIRMARALEAVEISLADHIVFSDDEYVSMLQSGYYVPEDAGLKV